MFIIGFEKTADRSTNNQGLETNQADTSNATANEGHSGMSPAGIESYSPAERMSDFKIKPRKKMNPEEMALFLTSQKVASSGIVEGLKYDSETPDMNQEEVRSKIIAEKRNRKSYVRAELK